MNGFLNNHQLAHRVHGNSLSDLAPLLSDVPLAPFVSEICIPRWKMGMSIAGAEKGWGREAFRRVPGGGCLGKKPIVAGIV